MPSFAYVWCGVHDAQEQNASISTKVAQWTLEACYRAKWTNSIFRIIGLCE
jgi:hypothetical protein